MRHTRGKPMSPTQAKWFARLFPIPFIIAGAAIFIFGVREWSLAKESSDWPSTDGVIIKSQVSERQSTTGSGSSRRTTTVYFADIVYDYTVNDQPFTGTRVSFGEYSSSNSTHARTVVKQYPVGSTVAVYYRPGEPDYCLLLPGKIGRASCRERV